MPTATVRHTALCACPLYLLSLLTSRAAGCVLWTLSWVNLTTVGLRAEEAERKRKQQLEDRKKRLEEEKRQESMLRSLSLIHLQRYKNASEEGGRTASEQHCGCQESDDWRVVASGRGGAGQGQVCAQNARRAR